MPLKQGCRSQLTAMHRQVASLAATVSAFADAAH
jgi:hypothetical protein